MPVRRHSPSPRSTGLTRAEVLIHLAIAIVVRAVTDLRDGLTGNAGLATGH